MRKLSPNILKGTKAVRTAVSFLNESYPQHDVGTNKIFMGFTPVEGEYQSWFIACRDYWTYTSKEFRLYDKAIQEQFPNIKIIYCYLHDITMAMYRKDKERLVIK